MALVTKDDGSIRWSFVGPSLLSVVFLGLLGIDGYQDQQIGSHDERLSKVELAQAKTPNFPWPNDKPRIESKQAEHDARIKNVEDDIGEIKGSIEAIRNGQRRIERELPDEIANKVRGVIRAETAREPTR